jgi:hypothetical protein
MEPTFEIRAHRVAGFFPKLWKPQSGFMVEHRLEKVTTHSRYRGLLLAIYKGKNTKGEKNFLTML